MKSFYNKLLFALIAVPLLGCRADHVDCMVTPYSTGCDIFYDSLESSVYPTCLYEPTHYFFCDVGNKACEEYMELTTNYFMNDLRLQFDKKYNSSLKKYSIEDGPFNELVEKVRHKQDVLYVGNPDDGIGVAPGFIVPCQDGQLELEFVISAQKISDPDELRNLNFVIGESPNEIRPRLQEILPDYCPTGGTGCLESFIVDYRLQEPINKQPIYMIGIISRTLSKEDSEVLQGLYDRLQRSDILFRGQILGTRRICASLGQKNEITVKDKMLLRLKREEGVKLLKEEQEKLKKAK